MISFNFILLIDDDEITNFINVKEITKFGIPGNLIQTCSSGCEALRFLIEFAVENENQAPELIIVDISMPGMDGFEFLEQLNEISFSNWEQIRIIFLSNSTADRDIKKIENKMHSYINKPLTVEKLKMALS
jgi:two-component SAPR family response regulator